MRAVCEAGAHRVVFQWESLLPEHDETRRESLLTEHDGKVAGVQAGADAEVAGVQAGAGVLAALARARALVASIHACGCTAGVCIAPHTPAEGK